MIAAASFGLRRSGRFATATSGAAYWAASVRHGPPWPLPVNAPKAIFQNSTLYRAANSVDSPPSCGEGLGVNFGASKKSSAGFPASGRDHTLEAVVRKLGVNRQQSLAREELGNTEVHSTSERRQGCVRF